MNSFASSEHKCTRFRRHFLLGFVFFVLCSVNVAAEVQAGWIHSSVDLIKNAEWGKKLIKNEIEIIVEYQKESRSYFVLGERKFIVVAVKIYMKDRKGSTLIGSIDTSAIRDANGNVIKSFGKNEYRGRILGISEEILQYPTSPSLVILDNDGTIRETDTVYPIDLNIEARSIQEFSIAY